MIQRNIVTSQCAGTPTSAKLRDPNEWLPNCRGSTNKPVIRREIALLRLIVDLEPFCFWVWNWMSDVSRHVLVDANDYLWYSYWVLKVDMWWLGKESYATQNWNQFRSSGAKSSDILCDSTSRHVVVRQVDTLPALMLTTIHLGVSGGAAN